MKKNISLMLSLVILICSAFPAAQAFAEENLVLPIDVTENYDYAEEVLRLVNEERNKVGASPLTMDKSLLDAAMLRAVETSLYFSHTRPDGRSCFTACSKMNGENIAAGSSTPEGIMQTWMNSSGHRGNILSENYKSIGVGCIKMGVVYYWVQCFSSGEADKVSASGTADKTVSINVAPEYFSLYYNSTSTLSNYQINGLNLCIVALNKGWDGRCCVLSNSLFTFNSSDPSVFTVDKNGILYPKHSGYATLTVTMKDYPEYSLTENLIVNGVHDYGEAVTVKAPTCETDGESVQVCRTCGFKKSTPIECRGYHDYDDGTLIEPTCTSAGKMVYICRDCGESYSVKYGSEAYHDWDDGKTLPYSKNDKYYTVVYTCRQCGKTEEYTNPVSDFGEYYGDDYYLYEGEYFGDEKEIPVVHKKPAPSELKKLKRGKKSFNAYWKKVKGVSGYQLQYSTKKNMKKSKTKTFKGQYKLNGSVKKLKKNKKYYVRVRSYKIVNGKRYYSKWSKVKTVKTR